MKGSLAAMHRKRQAPSRRGAAERLGCETSTSQLIAVAYSALHSKAHFLNLPWSLQQPYGFESLDRRAYPSERLPN